MGQGLKAAEAFLLPIFLLWQQKKISSLITNCLGLLKAEQVPETQPLFSCIYLVFLLSSNAAHQGFKSYLFTNNSPFPFSKLLIHLD